MIGLLLTPIKRNPSAGTDNFSCIEDILTVVDGRKLNTLHVYGVGPARSDLFWNVNVCRQRYLRAAKSSAVFLQPPDQLTPRKSCDIA